jgi:hypothetical protein
MVLYLQVNLELYDTPVNTTARVHGLLGYVLLEYYSCDLFDGWVMDVVFSGRTQEPQTVFGFFLLRACLHYSAQLAYTLCSSLAL